jgi:hypothetical protein
LLERAETEIRFVLANGMFKMKIDIDRHGPRPMPNNCKNFKPANFSLPTTFKAVEVTVNTKEENSGFLSGFGFSTVVGIVQPQLFYNATKTNNISLRVNSAPPV